MYFSKFQQVQVKKKAFQMGRLLTHPIQSNGIVCKGENVCHSKEQVNTRKQYDNQKEEEKVKSSTDQNV